MAIKQLSEELINQIAAGEVIENPSAVVKELVENSLDANSKNIEITLEESGLKKIIIKDDGDGIEKQDLLKAPLRHATSKIKNFNDLYSIKTMGFRGEALASIFSVAKSKIISKHKNSTQAYEINSKDITKIHESSNSQGTTIIVEDLFYNTPARKKYLRSKNIELKEILEIIKRFELIHHNKKFTLKHNGQIISTKPQFKTPEENLYYVLGKELKGNLQYFESQNQGLKIKGFIANPVKITYSYKKHQYFFVNQRYIKSKLLNDAIYEGFGSNLMTRRHPMFICLIQIDPEIVDVNVHPTKIEIRFENELEIFELLKKTIKNIFETQTLFKDFNHDEKEKNKLLSEKILEHDKQFIANPQTNKAKPKHKDYFTQENQKSFQIQEETISYQQTTPQTPATNQFELSEQRIQEIQNQAKQIKGPLFDELSEYKLLGQIDKTYIIIQTKTDMILIDQHIAEEKWLYEKFKNEKSKETTQTQKLLKPYLIELEPSEIMLYKENKQVLDQVGFDTDIFGERAIMIRAVPITIRKEIMHPEKFKDLLHDIIVNKDIRCVEEEKHSKIASMACRMAVMAGDELTMPQMRKMIENLRKLEQPFNCPHGRPTFLKYPLKDLEKKFKRIV